MTWERISHREDRGVTPVVAIILLFGLVAVSAMITMVAGMSLIDTIETQTDIEQTQQNFDVTSQQFQKAVMTGDPQGLPNMAASPELRSGTTTISFKRADVDFDEADYDTDWEKTSSPYEIDLNSVRYQPDGANEHFVFEGGGQWRVSDDRVTVQSAPQFRFSYDETLGLDVSLLNVDDSSQFSGADVVARTEGPGSNAIDESKLADVLEHDGTDGGEDIVIEIETEYYEAWEAALERHSDLDHEHINYYHDPDEDLLRIAIKQLATERSPTFNVDSIDTITETVEHGEDLVVEVTIENTGTASGSTAVDMSIEGDATETLSTDELSPGERQTITFEYASTPGGGDADGSLVDVGGISNKKHQIVSQYDEYAFEIETDNDSGTGSFLFSQPRAFYRIEAHEYDPSSGVVTAEFTNIAGDIQEYDVTFLLEGESADGEVEISEERTLEDLSQRSWEESTYEIDINQSRLPYGEYTYTIDVADTNFPSAHNNNPDASIATGTFELNAGNGVGTDPGEIVVDEPTDVNVSLIGTEISAEWYDPWEDHWTKRWAGVTSSAVVGDTRYRFLPDGSTREIDLDDPHSTGPGAEMEDFNLNTFGTQEQVYELEESLDEGSVTIEATYWQCETYEYESSDTYNSRDYDHYECTDFGDPITVDVSDGEIDPDSGFVMTRDHQRNDLPNIEEGYERQRSVAEVFDHGTDDVELQEDGLQLGTDDFAFMMEVTMDQDGLADEYDHASGYDGEYSEAFDSADPTLANQAAWDIAGEYRASSQTDTGDPNFNDVIGLVEVNPGESYVETENPLGEDPSIDGEQREVDTETSGVSGSTDDGSRTVDVGVDEIVIG